jgi:zinc protease
VASLFFAGDITLHDAVGLARKHFGDWTGTAPWPPVLPPPNPMPGRIFLVDRKGSTQTMVVQVLPGIRRDSPEFPMLMIADRIWDQRLNQNIRQDKGIAYGAWSGIEQLCMELGLWAAKSPVQIDRTREAMVEFMKELRGLAGERPITAQEFETQRQKMILGYPSQFEKNMPVAQNLSRDWGWGMPISEMQTLPRRLAAVSLEQVNAFVRKYAQADRAVFVLLGDGEKIEPGLRDLGLGDVVRLK